MPVIVVDGDDEALAVANDSHLGLQAAVYTSSLKRAFRFLDSLQVGNVVVNDSTDYWEAHEPFGGASGTTDRVGADRRPLHDARHDRSEDRGARRGQPRLGRLDQVVQSSARSRSSPRPRWRSSAPRPPSPIGPDPLPISTRPSFVVRK